MNGSSERFGQVASFRCLSQDWQAPISLMEKAKSKFIRGQIGLFVTGYMLKLQQGADHITLMGLLQCERYGPSPRDFLFI